MAFLKIKNRAASTLASGVDDAVTEWTLATGEGALFPTAGDFHVTCEDEIVKCTSRSDDVLTVVREQEGTTKAAHASGKAVELRITAGVVEEIQTVLDGGIDKTHLSQDFGASAGRLRNVIATPIAGEILRITNCSGGAFFGKINAAGTGGLTATNVPYDTDTYEDMFNGLLAYDGSSYWGQIILHNKTRSNSRKIVSVDIGNKAITTTSSTDDWADDDDIDCESQTCESGGTYEFVDIDLSDFVGTGVDAIILFVAFQNNVASGSASNGLYFHPYEAYNVGKRQWAVALLANEQSTGIFIIPAISQKITFWVNHAGTDDFYVILSVAGTVEYADT